jgi:hypothetical protein
MAKGGKQQAAAAGPLRALQMQMEREGLQQQQQQEGGTVEAGSSSSGSQALAAKRGRKSSSKAAGAAAAAAEFAVEDHKQEGEWVTVERFWVNIRVMLLLWKEAEGLHGAGVVKRLHGVVMLLLYHMAKQRSWIPCIPILVVALLSRPLSRPVGPTNWHPQSR